MKRRYLGCVTLAVGLIVSINAGPAAASSPVISYHVVAGWGDNALGTLGDGTTTNRVTYINTGGLTDVAQVSGGSDQSMALTTAGAVWTWGSNTHGALGTTPTSTAPQQVPGLPVIKQVAAGYEHSLALATDGTVWAWGDNSGGALGDGSTIRQRTKPDRVTGLTKIIRIAAGDQWSMALRADGTVWAWGTNAYWQLGSSTLAYSSTPIKINGLASVTSISAGASFGMAIETTGSPAVHTVWTWGQNSIGEIGNGAVPDPFDLGGVFVPFHVVGIPDAAGIAAGAHFGAVLGVDGSVWEWGGDWGNVLGVGAGGNPSLLPEMNCGPGTTFTQISAGDTHMLALRADGTVYAWGDNNDGELGNPTVTPNLGEPMIVLNLTGVTQVDAAVDFSLAVHATPVIAQL